MRVPGSLSALLFVGTLGWSGCSEPVSLSCSPGGDDVIVADNPFEGRWSAEAMSPQLLEEWRLPVPVQITPGAAATARITAQGSVLIADPGMGVITELDPDRQYAASERYLSADLVTALTDARMDDRLPLPDIHILPSGDFLAMLPPRPIEGGAPERRFSVVVRMTGDGMVLDTLYAVSTAVLDDHGYVEWPRPGTRIPTAAVGAGGVVAMAGASSAYRIDVLGVDFVDSLVVCREAPAFALTESETGEIERSDSLPGLAWLLSASRKVKPPTALGRMFLGQEGRLWVQRERADPQLAYSHPGGAAYDVFAGGGDYLGEVRAPERVVLIGEADGLVYGFESLDEGQVNLVAYGLR